MNSFFIKAYLAGPDVFLPDAAAHAQRKIEICAKHGIKGIHPANNGDVDVNPQNKESWLKIFNDDILMMIESDIIIANLTPFLGASADSGTLIELGWFLGQRKPIFAYSNSSTIFSERCKSFYSQHGWPVPKMNMENFSLPDNLMIPGAVHSCGGEKILTPNDDEHVPFDSLVIFERCVVHAINIIRSQK